MIKHIVMWKFKEENKEKNIDKFANELLQIKNIIPEIKSMSLEKSLNMNNDNYDMVLISEFESMQALQTYKINPAHVKVSNFCKSIRLERACIDYNI